MHHLMFNSKSSVTETGVSASILMQARVTQWRLKGGWLIIIGAYTFQYLKDYDNP